MNETAEQPADRCAADPVELVEQRHEEIKPPAVNAVGDLRRVVDAEGLVAHGVDQIIFFRPEIFVFFQHGDAVE